MTDDTQSTDLSWFGAEAATFGDRLLGAREMARMTQSQLSRRLGVKLSTIRAWEEDRSEPRANRLQMLSGLLGVSLPWLINGQGDGPDGPIEDPQIPSSVSDILLEMRAIKTEMTASAEKLSKLEKRLRSVLGSA